MIWIGNMDRQREITFSDMALVLTQLDNLERRDQPGLARHEIANLLKVGNDWEVDEFMTEAVEGNVIVAEDGRYRLGLCGRQILAKICASTTIYTLLMDIWLTWKYDKFNRKHWRVLAKDIEIMVRSFMHAD